MRAAYPTGQHLLATYNPSKIAHLLNDANLERIHCGRAPELSIVSQAYGREVTVAWLEIQLNHLSEFCGVKDRMPSAIIHELALIIFGTYHYLKMSEVMLFFARLMAGRYGMFYGTVDPIHIMNWMRTFIDERRDELERLEHLAEERRRTERYKQWRTESVTYEEYCARRVEEG